MNHSEEPSSKGGDHMTHRKISGKPATPSASPSGVAPARLHQRTGAAHAFGGYTKVNHGNGTFSMRKSQK